MKLVPNGKNVILNALKKIESKIELTEETRRKMEAERGKYQTTSVFAVGEKCDFVKKGNIVLVRATAIVPFEYEGNEYALVNEDLIVARLD